MTAVCWALRRPASDCFFGEFPGGVDAAALENRLGIREQPHHGCPTVPQRGRRACAPHHAHRSCKKEWGCLAHHCNIGEIVKHMNLASKSTSKSTEEVGFVGLCTAGTSLGEHLGCFSAVPREVLRFEKPQLDIYRHFLTSKLEGG